jgi:hypothetical protein
MRFHEIGEADPMPQQITVLVRLQQFRGQPGFV